MAGTTGATLLPKGDSLRNVLGFIGSPIFALMVAVGLAMFLLGRSQGWNRERTNVIMESALPPAATVILVTGAGGVFAKVLTASGIGTALSQSLTATHLPLILLAFIISLALRAAQGSATVAIITTCGLLADAIAGGGYSPCKWRCSRLPSALAALGCRTSTIRASGS